MTAMEQILCRHTVTKAETSFPKDALPAWRSVGWMPVDEWPAETSDEPKPPAEPEALAEPETTSTRSARTRGTTKE